MVSSKDSTVILGGGLSGLSAARVLTGAGRKAIVFEADSVVGGLSRTVLRGGFRFDLGGHRFFTTDREVGEFVRELMGRELIEVARKSQIYIGGRFIDYPLRPLNAVRGMGLGATARIVADYGLGRLKSIAGNGSGPSLEDWVVSKFGRTLFDIYFRDYSEKVWGLKCNRISRQWVAKRITGLSLGRAIKDAFFGDGRDKVPSLVDRFVYPELGIGRIADRLKEEIEKGSNSPNMPIMPSMVVTGAKIVELRHRDFRIECALAHKDGALFGAEGSEFVSTIPLTVLVGILKPPPPPEVLRAASRLGFRDLIVVAVMVDAERATGQSWIYIPEKKIPFGRIHEPKNWSEKMAPQGKTLLVAEYFCFRDDGIWKAHDGRIADATVENLEGLGLIRKSDVIDAAVVRVPRAYPLFEIGYDEHCETIYRYLENFKNLRAVGRGGAFRYLNMDHAIEAGMRAAKEIIGT